MKRADKDLPTAEDVRGIIPLTDRPQPTPAQIEAAAKVLMKHPAIFFNDDNAPETNLVLWLPIAKAALTAAAEAMVDEIAELVAVLEPLLDHYLNCYEGNADQLVLNARAALAKVKEGK